LDIAVLGTGYRAKPARTGIFRVVEQTAIGLAKRSDISLGLTATQSWENRYWVGRLLRDHPVLADSAFVPHGVGARAIDGANQFLWSNGNEAESSPLHSFGYPALRRLTDAISNRTPTISRDDVGAYDIFHSGMYPFPPQSRNLAKTRRVLTVYDLIPVLFPELFAHGMALTVKKIFHETLQSIGPNDFFLCISEATQRDLCAHLDIDPARTAITRLAASEELFFPVRDPERISAVTSRYGIPGEAQYLLSVNTLEPRKNMQHAIRSFSAMIQAERIRDLYFVLVGTNGWQYEEILATIADCNLAADRIIVTGYIPDDQLAPLYSGALAFVYPSLYEGFGLPPLEAMQCGTPVISSNTSSLPEVVGDSGITVDPNDSDSLSGAMLTLYAQSTIRGQLAKKSLERAKLFSWSHYTDAVVEGYNRARSI
jgi:glycosyltransferase involved in cell wall biosynthesis